MKPRIRRRRRQAGFTLIELMVSLVMFSFAIAGVLGVAVSLTVGYREQRQAIAAESSVRNPMDFIADAIRQASPGVSNSSLLTDASGVTCTTGAVTAINSSTGPDRLDIIFASGAVVTSTRSIVDGTNNASVDVTNISQFAPDDYIIITDTSQGHLFKIDTISGSTINFTSLCSGVTFPASGYPAGSLVIRAQHAEFYVEPTAIDGIPTLMMDPDGPEGLLPAEPLAEGVEDFQVALGVDSNSDYTITDTGANNDEWIGNNAADTAYVVGTGTVRAVRITIVSRAATPVQGTASPYFRPIAEDHGVGANDKYRRRVMRSTVEIRNLENSP